MSEHGLINLLTKEECAEYVSIIDSLSASWTKRNVGNYHYYTFGSASHLDIEPFDSLGEEVFDTIKNNNGVLKKNLQGLYDKVLMAISEKFGEAELVCDEGPIPGIFIYGEPRPNNITKDSVPSMGGKTKMHQDGQFKSLDYIWSKYKDVEIETIGFTLPLEVPQAGAAFLLWDQPDMGCYEDDSIADTYKSYDYSENKENVNVLTEFISNRVPNVVKHLPGRMFVQRGNQWHATGFSTEPYSTDRRITLQGFGVRCDGVWRLFF
jgi:hypothetical protein